MSENWNFYHHLAHGFTVDRPFLMGPENEFVVLYSELDRLTAGYAEMLGDAGVKRGDRIIVQLEKSPYNLLVYLSCLRAGVIYVPLNTAYQPAELDYFLKSAQPSLILCDPGQETVFSKLAGDVPVKTLTVDGQGSFCWREPTGAVIDVALNKDAVAAILYTSGTTGAPKGAMISHGNLRVNGQAFHQCLEWREDDILLHALPLFHIHGLFVACHLALLSASPIILLPRFEVEAVLQQMARATVYMGVPTHYSRLLDSAALSRERTATMRLFTSGSAPLLQQTFAAFKARTGHTIVERYGMTETGINCSNPVTGLQKVMTVGKPLSGVMLRVVDEQQQPLLANTTGELQVKGENVFQGYWQAPEKTATEFTPDGYFKTGDLAQLDEEGYFAIVGRSKDLIISGGFNVYPKEIELVLDRQPGIIESAVIGVPHSDFGEAVTAVVVTDDKFVERDIIQLLKQQLANYKVPKRIIQVSDLPRNTMGKVQKNILRESYKNLWD